MAKSDIFEPSIVKNKTLLSNEKIIIRTNPGMFIVSRL